MLPLVTSIPKLIETNSEQRWTSWRADRAILESVELFKKGKVLLTTSKSGEKGESSSAVACLCWARTEVCAFGQLEEGLLSRSILKAILSKD